MNVEVTIEPAFTRFAKMLQGPGKKLLFSAAANAVSVAARRHLLSEASRRHLSSQRLGARPSRHLEKGANKISFRADENHGEVLLPIPGISRAFGNLAIFARHARALTIPINKVSYARRAGELKSLGWTLFRPKGKDVLMGTKPGEDKAVALYILKKRVTQRQDRSLLPSDSTIGDTATKAYVMEIERIMRKAKRNGN